MAKAGSSCPRPEGTAPGTLTSAPVWDADSIRTVYHLRSTFITSAGICETPASTKVSPTNCVIPLEPGSGEMDYGPTTSRACTNSAASVQATFAPGEAWSKPRADSLVSGIPESRWTSTLRVGTGTDRVRISEPLTPSFRVVSIRDAHNFSGRAIRFVSNRH